MGKVTIYHATTGAAINRWPVDARGMVENGEYRLTPPNVPDTPAPEWARGITIRSPHGKEKATTGTQDTDQTHGDHANEAVGGSSDAQSQDATGQVARPLLDQVVLPGGQKVTPLGEPVRSTHSRDATPAHPFTPPVGYTKAGFPDKRFKP